MEGIEILPSVAAVAGADPQTAEKMALETTLAMARLAGMRRNLRLKTSNKSPAMFELAKNSAIRTNMGIINVTMLVD
jgi:hypothetical protein